MTLNDPYDLEAGRASQAGDAVKLGTPDIRVDPETSLDPSNRSFEHHVSGQNRYQSNLVSPNGSESRRLRPASPACVNSEVTAEKPAAISGQLPPSDPNALSLRHKPSVAFTATSGVAPQTFRDLAVLYQVVAEVGLRPISVVVTSLLIIRTFESAARALTIFFGNARLWL